VSKKPRSILEYPIVTRKVLEDMVISLPDIGIWVQVPLPPKKIVNGVSQTDLNDEYVLKLAKALKETWIKGHKHITEKKWVPEASTFKQSVKKAQKDLTVPEFLTRIQPYIKVCDNTIRREIRRGIIKAYTTAGGHRRIPESEVEIYLEKCQKISTSKTRIELDQ
jgi:excisionase family DNA binding protein